MSTGSVRCLLFVVRCLWVVGYWLLCDVCCCVLVGRCLLVVRCLCVVCWLLFAVCCVLVFVVVC